MNCLRCTHLDLQSNKDHARVGLGWCAAKAVPGVFEPFARERECVRFAEAAPDVLEARLKWNESRSGK